MVSLTALIVWRLSPFLVFFPWLIIACVDGLYISSALTKVPDGAWFTLTLAGALASIFILWRFGKEQQWKMEAADRFPTTHLVKKRDDGQVRLTDRYGGEILSIIKGFGIFFDKAGDMTPIVFSQFLTKLASAPEVMVFFHLRPLETPSVPPESRCTVSRLAIPNCYRLIVRHGYMDEVVTPNLASLVYGQVRDFIIRQGNAHIPPVPLPSVSPQTQENESAPPPQAEGNDDILAESSTSSSDAEKKPQSKDDEVSAELAKLQEAYDRRILYIIGKEQLKVKAGTKFWRKVPLRAFLWVRDNTRTKIANLRVPTERVIEVGFYKEI
jgi:KUP system potassium uptake protein